MRDWQGWWMVEHKHPTFSRIRAPEDSGAWRRRNEWWKGSDEEHQCARLHLVSIRTDAKSMMMRMPILCRPASLLGSLYSLKIYIRNVYFKNTVNYSYYCHFYCVMGHWERLFSTLAFLSTHFHFSVSLWSRRCRRLCAATFFCFFARTERCIWADRIFGTTKKKV